MSTDLVEQIRTRTSNLRCTVLFQFVGEKANNNFYVTHEDKNYIEVLMPCKVLHARSNASQNLWTVIKDQGITTTVPFTELAGKTLAAASIVRIRQQDGIP